MSDDNEKMPYPETPPDQGPTAEVELQVCYAGPGPGVLSADSVTWALVELMPGDPRCFCGQHLQNRVVLNVGGFLKVDAETGAPTPEMEAEALDGLAHLWSSMAASLSMLSIQRRGGLDASSAGGED